MTDFLELARSHHVNKEYQKACRYYQHHLTEKPDDPHTLYLYGTCLLQGDLPGLGTVFLKRSCRLRPAYVPALSNLGAAYRTLARDEQAIAVLREAIEAARAQASDDPGDIKALAEALSNLGAVLHTRGEDEEATKVLSEALEICADLPIAHWNLGLSLLKQREWKKGWDGYDWGYKAGERKQSAHIGRYKEWLGEDLTNQTILVWGEQGIGDEIQFASCIPDLEKEAGRIILDCHPRLETIFSRSFPDIEVVGRRKDPKGTWAQSMGVDYHIPIGSLPRRYRNEDKDFPGTPFLVPNKTRAEWWKKQHEGKVRIGLSWRGGRGDQGRPKRSIPLEKWGQIIRPIEGVVWTSLQYGEERYAEVQRANEQFGIDINHHDFAFEGNFDETCNITAACDLVISVQVAAVHVAGALGVPCWAMIPKGPTWRYVTGEKLPWYDSVRQFHQEKLWDWGPVMEKVSGELDKFLEKRL